MCYQPENHWKYARGLLCLNTPLPQCYSSKLPSSSLPSPVVDELLSGSLDSKAVKTNDVSPKFDFLQCPGPKVGYTEALENNRWISLVSKSITINHSSLKPVPPHWLPTTLEVPTCSAFWTALRGHGGNLDCIAGYQEPITPYLMPSGECTGITSIHLQSFFKADGSYNPPDSLLLVSTGTLTDAQLSTRPKSWHRWVLGCFLFNNRGFSPYR